MELRNFQEARLLFRGVDTSDAGSEKAHVIPAAPIEAKAPEDTNALQARMDAMAAVMGGEMDEVLANKDAKYPKRLVAEVAKLKGQFDAHKPMRDFRAKLEAELAEERQKNGGFKSFDQRAYSEYRNILTTDMKSLELNITGLDFSLGGISGDEWRNQQVFIDGIIETCKELGVAPEAGLLQKLGFKKGAGIDFDSSDKETKGKRDKMMEKIKSRIYLIQNNPDNPDGSYNEASKDKYRAYLSDQVKNLNLDLNGTDIPCVEAEEYYARYKFVDQVIALCRDYKVAPTADLLEKAGFIDGENVDYYGRPKNQEEKDANRASVWKIVQYMTNSQ